MGIVNITMRVLGLGASVEVKAIPELNVASQDKCYGRDSEVISGQLWDVNGLIYVNVRGVGIPLWNLGVRIVTVYAWILQWVKMEY